MGFGPLQARQVLVSQPQTGPLDKQEMIKDDFIALIVNSIITVLNFYIGTSCTYLWAFRPMKGKICLKSLDVFVF